jgi:hypothetical protein
LSAESQRAVLIRAALQGRATVPIKALRGFDKRQGHAVPKLVDDSTNRWVRSLAEGDLRAALDPVFADIQQCFSFKRREVAVTIDAGDGGIQTPSFGYSVSIDQSPDAPGEAVVLRTLDEITDLRLLESDAFQSVFGPWFDQVELQLAERLDIEGIIDHVEADDASPLRRRYPPDCSSCTLWLDGEPWRVVFQGRTIAVKLDQQVTPRELLAGYLACLEALGRTPALSVALLPTSVT